MSDIPRRFIRIWLGSAAIPEMFELWWAAFQRIHPDFEFMTITDHTELEIPDALQPIYRSVDSYAGRSDILRIIALYKFGGVYVDTDVMPLRSFVGLLDDPRPFIAKRSSKSFESAVIGSPAQHRALLDLMKALPAWFAQHRHNAASVQTGPAFVSAHWFGRLDIRHLAAKTFYPYNGFMAPGRSEKLDIFSDPANFPPEMLAAHFSNHRWGGKPRDE